MAEEARGMGSALLAAAVFAFLVSFVSSRDLPGNDGRVTHWGRGDERHFIKWWRRVLVDKHGTSERKSLQSVQDDNPFSDWLPALPSSERQPSPNSNDDDDDNDDDYDGDDAQTSSSSSPGDGDGDDAGGGDSDGGGDAAAGAAADDDDDDPDYDDAGASLSAPPSSPDNNGTKDVAAASSSSASASEEGASSTGTATASSTTSASVSQPQASESGGRGVGSNGGDGSTSPPSSNISGSIVTSERSSGDKGAVAGGGQPRQQTSAQAMEQNSKYQSPSDKGASKTVNSSSQVAAPAAAGVWVWGLLAIIAIGAVVGLFAVAVRAWKAKRRRNGWRPVNELEMLLR